MYQDESYGRLSPVDKSPMKSRRRARTPGQDQTIKREGGNKVPHSMTPSPSEHRAKKIKTEENFDLIEFTPPRHKSDREEKPKSDYGVKEEEIKKE